MALCASATLAAATASRSFACLPAMNCLLFAASVVERILATSSVCWSSRFCSRTVSFFACTLAAAIASFADSTSFIDSSYCPFQCFFFSRLRTCQ